MYFKKEDFLEASISIDRRNNNLWPRPPKKSNSFPCLCTFENSMRDVNMPVKPTGQRHHGCTWTRDKRRIELENDMASPNFSRKATIRQHGYLFFVFLNFFLLSAVQLSTIVTSGSKNGIFTNVEELTTFLQVPSTDEEADTEGNATTGM